MAKRKQNQSTPSRTVDLSTATVDQQDVDAQSLADGTVITLESGRGDDKVVVDVKNRTIKNVALISIGMAKGHGFELDQRSLETYVEAYNANKGNIKSHLGHPRHKYETDSMVWLIGEMIGDVRIDGDTARGDFQLFAFANKGPQGELTDFVLAAADEAPHTFGTSMSGAFDFERVFNDDGEVEKVLGRIKTLTAHDFVGSPAANRKGLLSEGNNPDATKQPGKATQNSTPMEGIEMSKKLKSKLVSLGLSADASDEQAWNFYAALSAKNRDAFKGELSQGDQTHIKTLELDDSPDPAKQPVAPAGQQPADASLSTEGTPAPAPQAATELSGERVAELAAAERTRCDQIRNLSSELGIDEDLTTKAINGNWTADKFRGQALEQYARDNAPIKGLGTKVGDDGRESFVTGLSDAWIMDNTDLNGVMELDDHGQPKLDDNGDLALRQPHKRAGDFQFMGLQEQCRGYLTALGVPDVNRMSQTKLFEVISGGKWALASMGVGDIALSSGTGDFPALFANVQNKFLAEGYDNEDSTWEEWCDQLLLKDFKEGRIHALGGMPVPPEVHEGGTYEYRSMGDKYEPLQLVKHGVLFGMTWEGFLNDDMNAITSQALDLGGAARELEGDKAYGALTANGTMTEDATACFHANHSNLNEGTQGVPTIARASAMRSAMRQHKKPESDTGRADGRRMSMRPAVALVPDLLGDSTMQLFGSTVDTTKSNNTPNYKFVRQLKIVSDPRLDEDSATAWYAVAAKRKRPVTMAFLRGNRRPFLQRQNAAINTDGVIYKLRHVCVGAITEWRAMQKNDG